MNEYVTKSQSSDEIALSQLFRLIVKVFDPLISFKSSIFKSVISVFIYILSELIDVYKIIIISIIIITLLDMV